MEAKKLLADENKKQRVKQNKYVSWVLYVKFRIEKDHLVKYFAFLENVCYQYLNCVLRVTSCFFMSCWLAHNHLSWKVLLFSCNSICHICLSGPGYSSRTVRKCSLPLLL